MRRVRRGERLKGNAAGERPSTVEVEEFPAVWRTGSNVWTLTEEGQGQGREREDAEAGGHLNRGDGDGGAGLGLERAGERVGTLFRSMFFPTDYPASVSSDYAPWLRWHLGSLFIRDILQVLSSQSLLIAVSSTSVTASSVVASLGPNTSATLAATTAWVLKDAPGSLSTLIVGSRGGQAFDEDPKRWWVISSALEDAARLVEILLPLNPRWFLPGAALANFIRSGALVGRQSIVNGTLLRHFSKRENLSDVRAKLEAQGRILAIASLPVGIALFRWSQSLIHANDHDATTGQMLAFLLYAGIFSFHNVCCYNAARCLVPTVLNTNRLTMLATQFLAQGRTKSPSQNAESEGVSLSLTRQQDIVVGCSFKSFQEKTYVPLLALIPMFEGLSYILTLSKKEEEWQCLVCMKSIASDANVIQAVLNAQILLNLVKEEDKEPSVDEAIKCMAASITKAQEELESFNSKLEEAGWQLNVVRGPWSTIQISL